MTSHNPPLIVVSLLLIGLRLVGVLLVGYDMKNNKKRILLYLFATFVALLIIIDLEFSCLGFINLRQDDQALVR
jgi:hypothetical protein